MGSREKILFRATALVSIPVLFIQASTDPTCLAGKLLLFSMALSFPCCLIFSSVWGGAHWYAKQALSALLLFGSVYVLYKTGVSLGSAYFIYAAAIAQGAALGISVGTFTSVAFLILGYYLKEEKCSSI